MNEYDVRLRRKVCAIIVIVSSDLLIFVLNLLLHDGIDIGNSIFRYTRSSS